MVEQHSALGGVSIEAISVAFAASLVWLAALVQHLTNVVQRGTPYVIGDRSVPPPQVGFFGRATRALANNVESALMWVPPMAVILFLHRSSGLSQLSAETYIGARSVFLFSYWLKIPLARSGAWFVGMMCCATAIVLAIVPVS